MVVLSIVSCAPLASHLGRKMRPRPAGKHYWAAALGTLDGKIGESSFHEWQSRSSVFLEAILGTGLVGYLFNPHGRLRKRPHRGHRGAGLPRSTLRPAATPVFAG